MPNLGPNSVSVTIQDNSVYSIQFSADLGDVSLLEEITQNVNFTVNETLKGVPSGKQFQLNIQNSNTVLFSLTDTSNNVYLNLILILNSIYIIHYFFSD